jgi:hypothetical protein
MQKKLTKAFILGIMTLVVGSVVGYVIGKFAGVNLPSVCKKWNKNHIMELCLFLTGVFVYIICELSGINKCPKASCNHTKTTTTCGMEGHFSHSSGGGKFSWNAVRLNRRAGMPSPYMFIMFETYIDGTSDHFVVDVIDLPTMSADVVTADGTPSVLQLDNVTVSAPDTASMPALNKAKKDFFDMLPCYSGSYSGQGTQ